MLSQYRALLARAGARPLLLACALGWPAFTGYALAIILAVQAATHSFGVAGGAVAAFSAGSGLAAPARGRFIDRHGARGLALFGVAHACAVSALVAGCALHAQPVVLVGACALAGAVVPPLIATARMLWADVAGPGLARPAHALNASLAEVAQLLSPGLTAGLAAVCAPSLALAVLVTTASAAVVLVAVGARHRRPIARPRGRRFWGVLGDSAGLRTLVACDVAGGVWAGALEVAVTALASRHGGAELAAIPLSAGAVGGMLAGLWVGSRPVSPSAAARYVGGSVAVGALFPLALIRPSLATVTGVTLLAGAGYGVLGVALFELLDQVVSADGAVEAFTWLTTGQAAGTAAGAAAAGQLTQAGGVAAFGLVAAGAVAAGVTAAGRRRSLHEVGLARQEPTSAGP